MARQPDTGEFYASQDESSTILRIDHRSKTTTQLPIPAEQGSGTFGSIDGHGALTWLRLTSPQVSRAGLLHSTFDSPPARRGPSVWLLGSSIISPNTLDVIIRVTFDSATAAQLVTEPGAY